MSDSGPHPASREPDRDGFWTTLPGILTGLAALITAIIGLVSLLGQSNEAPSDPNVAVAPAPSDVSAPTSAGAASASGGAAAAAPAPRLFTEGRITMRTPDSVDLEKGVVGSPAGLDLYLYCSGTECFLNAMQSLLTVADEAESREACVAALKKRHDQALQLDQLREGQGLCVQTEEGHVGRMKLLGLPGPGSIDFSFSYMLWM